MRTPERDVAGRRHPDTCREVHTGKEKAAERECGSEKSREGQGRAEGIIRNGARVTANAEMAQLSASAQNLGCRKSRLFYSKLKNK